MSTSLVMPRRISRSPEDITVLADMLRPRWKPAIGIEPWLRRNVRMLTRLVRDERWTWEDIGRALTEAGIVYETGRPWERKMLTVKVSEARKAIREKQATAAEPNAVAEPAPVTSTPPPASYQPSHQAEEPPRRRSFRTVTLPEGTQAAPPEPAEPAEEPASAPAAKQDADAVYRRLFGNRKD